MTPLRIVTEENNGNTGGADHLRQLGVFIPVNTSTQSWGLGDDLVGGCALTAFL